MNGEKVARGNYGFSTMYYKQGSRPADYNKIESDRLGELEATTEEAKKWKGWGSSLKPAYEPIVVARKPFDGSLVNNVLEYGVGGLNIDECRVETSGELVDNHKTAGTPFMRNAEDYQQLDRSKSDIGRFPANIITDGSDEVAEGFPETKSNGGSTTMPDLRDVGRKSKEAIGIDKLSFGQVSGAERKGTEYVAPEDEGSAMRYFYVAKEGSKDFDDITPNLESIVVARKPLDGTLVDNVTTWGVGGINIDECRIPLEEGYEFKETKRHERTCDVFSNDNCGFKSENNTTASANPDGRFPANVITDGSDEVTSGFPETKSTGGSGEASIVNNFKNVYGEYKNGIIPSHLGGLGDEGSASRYFYCAKASKKDRDEGLDEMPNTYSAVSNQAQDEFKRGNNEFADQNNSSFNKVYVGKNTHPTVKPTQLMQYLVRLVSPKGATILDPFMGSGSTGKACMIENTERNANYKFIGIEMTEEYLPIADARIRYWVDREIEEEVKEDIKPTSKEDVVKLW